MSSYEDLISELMQDISQEDSTGDGHITETIILDDEKNGTTVIGKDILTVLDRNKVNYIVNTDKVKDQNSLDNAVVDGVYQEVLDQEKRKKVKIIYDDTLNVDDDVDAYIVQTEEIAESMEAAGLTVIRYPNQLIEYLKK